MIKTDYFKNPEPIASVGVTDRYDRYTVLFRRTHQETTMIRMEVHSVPSGGFQAMSPQQARQLGQRLIEMADIVEQRRDD